MSEKKAPPQAMNEELDRMFAMSIALEEAEGGDSLFFRQDFDQFAKQFPTHNGISLHESVPIDGRTNPHMIKSSNQDKDSDASSYEYKLAEDSDDDIGDSNNEVLDEAAVPQDEKSAANSDSSFEYIFHGYGSVDEIPLQFIRTCNSIQDLEQICKSIAHKEDQKRNLHWEAAKSRLSELRQTEKVLRIMKEQFARIEQEEEECSSTVKKGDIHEDDGFVVLVPSDVKQDSTIEDVRKGVETIALDSNKKIHPELTVDNLRWTIVLYSKQNMDEVGMPIKNLMEHFGIHRMSPPDRQNRFQTIVTDQCVLYQAEEVGWVLFLKEDEEPPRVPRKKRKKAKVWPQDEDFSVDSDAAVDEGFVSKRGWRLADVDDLNQLLDGPDAVDPRRKYNKKWNVEGPRPPMQRRGSLSPPRRKEGATKPPHYRHLQCETKTSRVMEDYFKDPNDLSKRKQALDYIENCYSKHELRRIIGRLFDVVEGDFGTGCTSVQAAATKRLNAISPKNRDSRSAPDEEFTSEEAI